MSEPYVVCSSCRGTELENSDLRSCCSCYTLTRKAPPCRRCGGDRIIANTEEGEPWRYWLELPLRNALAVITGVVRPIPCPECNADGHATYQEKP